MMIRACYKYSNQVLSIREKVRVVKPTAPGRLRKVSISVMFLDLNINNRMAFWR